jgi:hypothetical protein
MIYRIPAWRAEWQPPVVPEPKSFFSRRITLLIPRMVKSRRTAVPVVPPPITIAVYRGMFTPAFKALMIV